MLVPEGTHRPPNPKDRAFSHIFADLPFALEVNDSCLGNGFTKFGVACTKSVQPLSDLSAPKSRGFCDCNPEFTQHAPEIAAMSVTLEIRTRRGL